MKDFSITDVFSRAFTVTKANLKFLLVVTLLTLLVTAVIPTLVDTILGVLFSTKNPATGKFELSLYGLLLSGIFRLGLVVYSFVLSIGGIKISLNLVQEKPTTVHDLFNSHGVYLPFIFVSFITGVIVMMGFFFFIIPGIIFALMFSFSTYVLIDEQSGFSNALSRSRELTGGIKGKLFLFEILSGLINVGGGLCFGIGILFTLPLTMLAKTYVYESLKSQSISSPILPPSTL